MVALSNTIAFVRKPKTVQCFWSVMEVIGSWWRLRMPCLRTGFHESRKTDVLKALKLISETVSSLGARV